MNAFLASLTIIGGVAAELRRWWSEFMLWYREPTLSKRVRARRRALDFRQWQVEQRERTLNDRWDHLRDWEMKLREQERWLGSLPAVLDKVDRRTANMEQRLDSLDDGYGALLGIDRTE